MAGAFTGSATVVVVVVVSVVVVVVSCAAARPVSANAVSMRIFFITVRILGSTLGLVHAANSTVKSV